MFKLRQVASVAAAAVSLAFGMTSAQAAPTIKFVVGAGGSVDVVVEDLGGDIVAAYDLDVSYDASALTFTGFAFSSELGDLTPFDPLTLCSPEFCGDVLDLGGLVDFWGLSLLGDAALFGRQNGDSVTLATLKFDGTDFSSLAFVNWGTGLPTNDVKGARNQVIIPGGQIPEPATYGLVGLALLAAGVARRRQV